MFLLEPWKCELLICLYTMSRWKNRSWLKLFYFHFVWMNHFVKVHFNRLKVTTGSSWKVKKEKELSYFLLTNLIYPTVSIFFSSSSPFLTIFWMSIFDLSLQKEISTSFTNNFETLLQTISNICPPSRTYPNSTTKPYWNVPSQESFSLINWFKKLMFNCAYARCLNKIWPVTTFWRVHIQQKCQFHSLI